MILNLDQLTQFSQAGREVLHYLKQHLGFDLWMITRVNGNDWIVLQAEDQGYSVVEGDVLNWSDSFCSQMVQGLGPNIAPCAMQVINYANTPIAQKLPIEAYVGYPIVYANGELFGTLCGIDPKQQPIDLEKQAPLLELLSQLLSRLLQLEWQHIQMQRDNQRLANEALIDSLTGAYNRRAWQAFIDSEEQNCRTFGNEASVFVLDLNDLKKVNDQGGHLAGDKLLQMAVHSMQSVLAPSDILARLGGDEFAILAVDRDLSKAEALHKLLQRQLNQDQVSVAIGMAVRDHHSTLNDAFKAADQRMYEHKRQIKENATDHNP
ncbi:MAG: sensor domain-containing diguanylate cyclase [Gammaproteobacteria bacterium]|nr:sensor domain-containing diguanylate cyclase [Gammaproteobacteria bacterium]